MALRVRKNRATFPAGIVPPLIAMESCPLDRAMSVLAGAWAPQVVWHLTAQPRRFGELRVDLPGVSARVLSQRLRELETNRVVVREVVAADPSYVEYSLTELGRQFLPVLALIAEVGKQLLDSQVSRRR